MSLEFNATVQPDIVFAETHRINNNHPCNPSVISVDVDALPAARLRFSQKRTEDKLSIIVIRPQLLNYLARSCYFFRC
jgi:hypothetical protein